MQTKQQPEEVDSVSIAPPSSNAQHQQRKSSIFKSRSTTQPSQDRNSSVKGESAAATKGKKGLALYRHTWHEDDARKASASVGADGQMMTTAPSAAAGTDGHQQHSHPSSPSWDELGDEPPTKLARLGTTHTVPSSLPQKLALHSSEPDDDDELAEGSGGSLRCARKVKDYYTVVRNVKKAHQIQESGEFQEFNDDVDYILDALQDRNPTATR